MYQNIATGFYPQTKDAPNDAPTAPFDINIFSYYIYIII